jgi:spore germination protein KA
VVAAELVASFAMPDYFAAHPFRILKFLVILMTGLLGLYGFMLAITVILTSMVSQDSFGVPYMAPFNRYDFRRVLMFSRATSPYRQRYLKTKDNTRTDFYRHP